MALTNDVSQVEYNGDGTNRSFVFNSLVFEKKDLEVLIDGNKVSANDFLATGFGQERGVTVTYPAASGTAALTATQKIVIRRTLTFTQPQQINNQGGFFPDVVEKGFDRLTMLSQQLDRRVSAEEQNTANPTPSGAVTGVQQQTDAGVWVPATGVGGTANEITLTPDPAVTAYVGGLHFRFKAEAVPTGNVTVNVSGLGNKALHRAGGQVGSGGLSTTGVYDIVYDGTVFWIIGAALGDAAMRSTGVAAGNVPVLDANGKLKTSTYIQGTPPNPFDLYTDVTTEMTDPSWNDRLVAANVGKTGEPNEFLELDTLVNKIDGVSGQKVSSINNDRADGLIKFWFGTKAQYDAITSKDSTTLYLWT